MKVRAFALLKLEILIETSEKAGVVFAARFVAAELAKT